MTTWLVSVAAVGLSGATAWLEGNWRRRPGLAMGFRDHGGMWGDLLLLPLANAAMVPHLDLGWWIAPAVLVSTAASFLVHRLWYRGDQVDGTHEHMWPAHTHGTWPHDLSWAGWCHVAYVIAELTLLVGFLIHPMPIGVVVLVTAIFTVHVPLGLLQPRWFVVSGTTSGGDRWPTVWKGQPLLAPCLAALWLVAATKLA